MLKPATQLHPVGVQPDYSSGYVTTRLDESRRKIELYLSVQCLVLASKELRRMAKTVRCLRVNFPPRALAKGPVLR